MGSLLPFQEVCQVLNHGSKDLQSISHPAGTAREVRQEDIPPGSGKPTGKGGVGRFCLTNSPNRFGETWGPPVDHRLSRLGGHIPGAEPSPSGSEDDIHVPAIGPPKENGNDGFRLIRNHTSMGYHIPLFQAPIRQGLAAGILSLPPATCIGDGENAYPEGSGPGGGHLRTEPSV